MEARRGADQVGPNLERDAAGHLGVLQGLYRGEVAHGQRRVGQRPEILRRLQLRRLGRQDQQAHVLRHAQPGAGMPAGPVRDEHGLLARARPDGAGERRQHGLEERDADRGGEVEDRAAGGEVHEADEVASGTAALDRRYA